MYNILLMDLAKQIGKRIKIAREEARLTQDDVADKLDIGRAQVANIETGRTLITVEHLLKLPAILNYPVGYFLGVKDELTADEMRLLTIYRSLPQTGPTRFFAQKSILSLLEAIEILDKGNGP